MAKYCAFLLPLISDIFFKLTKTYLKNNVNHFLIAFKPIKGFSLLATTDFILITVDGGSGGFNGDRQMH